MQNMNTNVVKIGAPAAVAGALEAPIIIGVFLALVLAGGICAGIVVLASSAKKVGVHINKNGADINVKK